MNLSRKRWRALLALACAVVALATACLPARAEALPAAVPPEGGRFESRDPSDAPDLSLSRMLPMGGMAEVSLTAGGTVFQFTPASNGLYGVYLFPAEEQSPRAHLELWQDDALLLESDALLPAMTLRLTADALYTLRVTGSGRARLEVTRQALNRCFGQPLALEATGDEYAKSIARPGDAHWYGVEAASDEPLLLLAVPVREGLRLRCQLFDAGGRLLAEGLRTAGGACLLDLNPRAGQRYALRVSASNGMSGLYGLRLVRADGGILPDRVVLSSANLVLAGRESAALTAGIRPDGASDMLFWESADPAIAEVDGSGNVTGRHPGITAITAYGMGGVSARCIVRVADVAVTGIAFEEEDLLLRAGERAEAEWHILPANAVDRQATLTSSDEDVVRVEEGELVAVAEGAATVTARSRDGGYAADLSVRVLPSPRRYRALLIGQQNYAATVAVDRPGTANTIGNLRGMLGTLSYSGESFRVATQMDEGRDGIIAGLRETFAGASDIDFSLIYITCHGYYANGMTCFQLVDGSMLTAPELERELRRVPGELLVLIDCCGSGGVIGRYSTTSDILSGIGAVFGGQAGGAPMATSRYRVLASAALEQDSYRIGFTKAGGDAEMDTVFARALCEAGGWDVDHGTRSAMCADLNYDGEVSMAELYGYLTRRALWLLSRANALSEDSGILPQTVKLWPETDAATVFARTAGD